MDDLENVEGSPTPSAARPLTPLELLRRWLEQSSRELALLLDFSQAVSSTLELEALLDVILDQLRLIVEYHGATILTLSEQVATVVANRHPPGYTDMLRLQVPRERLSMSLDVVERREQVIIGDVRGDKRALKAFRRILGDGWERDIGYARCWMAAPLICRGRVIGVLNLSHGEPHYFTLHQAALVMTVANQAAMAMENARLYDQARALAVLQERQRLARELHDSTAQALYGIKLGVNAAQALLGSDPTRVQESLAYILTLAEDSLADLRAIFFDLHPALLVSEGLVTALDHQAASLRAHHTIAIQTDLGAEPTLSLEVKESLYRIAQEALHNVLNHAHARVAHLRLRAGSRHVLLEVRDDGQGFDPGGAFPGHLGLRLMRERAERLGATLEITSAPGRGTRVRLRYPLPRPAAAPGRNASRRARRSPPGA